MAPGLIVNCQASVLSNPTPVVYSEIDSLPDKTPLHHKARGYEYIEKAPLALFNPKNIKIFKKLAISIPT